MVAAFYIWRQVNTKSAVRDSGRSSLTEANREVRSSPSTGAPSSAYMAMKREKDHCVENTERMTVLQNLAALQKRLIRRMLEKGRYHGIILFMSPSVRML